MKPTKKSPEVEAFLDSFFHGQDGVSFDPPMEGTSQAAIIEERCLNPPIGCGLKVMGFRDERSQKEFTISGLCQGCQDSIFGVG